MKTMLKTIALCLAIGASAQTVKSYADETANLTDLITEQGKVLMALISGEKQEFSESDEETPVLSEVEKKQIIVKNMIHYIRLIEGQEELLDELQKQEFPELDINTILEGRRNPGI